MHPPPPPGILKELLLFDKAILNNKKLGLIPFCGIGPKWLTLSYHTKN
jgi:hypothetical protein